MITEERKRGGCLTAWLILMLIANPLVAVYYLAAGHTVKQALPNLPEYAIPLLIFLGIANFVFALAIWSWKKWGMYGFACSAAIAFIINLTNLGVGPSLLGLVGVGILVALVSPVWKQMD